MNETKLSGRLTKDPVVRYTSSGNDQKSTSVRWIAPYVGA